jgi:hypothetical protein
MSETRVDELRYELRLSRRDVENIKRLISMLGERLALAEKDESDLAVRALGLDQEEVQDKGN